MKEPKKQNIVRQLSSCLMEKYNGFQVISIEIEIEPLSYFSDDI